MIDINKLRGLEANVLIDAGSPINAGSLLNAGKFYGTYRKTKNGKW